MFCEKSSIPKAARLVAARSMDWGLGKTATCDQSILVRGDSPQGWGEGRWALEKCAQALICVRTTGEGGGGLLKCEANSVAMQWGLRVCTPRAPGDGDAAGPGTTLRTVRLYRGCSQGTDYNVLNTSLLSQNVLSSLTRKTRRCSSDVTSVKRWGSHRVHLI